MEQESENIALSKPLGRKRNFLWLRAYFFQFFMLFLAVSGGFYADNLREEFNERKQAKEYTIALINDLVRDTLNIQYQISRINSAVSNIENLVRYVRGKKIEELDGLELYRLTQFTPNPAFRWTRTTIEQIKGSGSLRFFANDSIVYFISQYDSWTLHLDQDNMLDQLRYLDASRKRSEVIDLNYSEEFKTGLKSNLDSVRRAMNGNASSKLLTNNLDEVKSMVNVYILAKEFSAGRVNELRTLIRNQRQLIRLLKREYGLK